MIIVIGRVQLQSGTSAKVIEALNVLLPKARSDDGFISYDFGQDIENPNIIHFSERWRDMAAFDKHNAQPHLAEFQAAAASFLAAAPELDVYQTDGKSLI